MITRKLSSINQDNNVLPGIYGNGVMGFIQFAVSQYIVYKYTTVNFINNMFIVLLQITIPHFVPVNKDNMKVGATERLLSNTVGNFILIPIYYYFFGITPDVIGLLVSSDIALSYIAYLTMS